MKNNSKKNNNQKGFSLIEVLLAVVLLALVATPLIQCFYTSMSVNQKSKKNMAATQLAQNILEYYESQVYTDFDADFKDDSKITLKCVKITKSDGSVVDYTSDNATISHALNYYGRDNSYLLKDVPFDCYYFDVILRFTEINTGDEYCVDDILIEVFDVRKDSDGTSQHDSTNDLLVQIHGSMFNKR